MAGGSLLAFGAYRFRAFPGLAFEAQWPALDGERVAGGWTPVTVAVRAGFAPPSLDRRPMDRASVALA
jgi:hypothetical protein